jgi:hypothetical protein
MSTTPYYFLMHGQELCLSIKKRANRVYYRSVKTAHESRLPQHAREKGHSGPKSKNKPK